MQLARPTAQQLAWHDLEVMMFVHFDLATFDGGGGHRVPEHFDLSRFNPAELDVEQWCDVAESLGAKQVVHVAKHGSGFCNWQTQTTEYGVRNTPWRNGRGDILKDLSASCHRRGLKLGVYLCPYDAYHGATVAGVCRDAASQERYNAVYRQQLTEVLTQYGEISELWFDGSTAMPIEDIIDRYAPGVVCFLGPKMGLRWPGTEKGVLPYPAWNGVRRRDAMTGKVTAAHSDPDGECWLPMECDTPIRDHYWFWDVDG
jgi:alpha-L-fucosidase